MLLSSLTGRDPSDQSWVTMVAVAAPRSRNMTEARAELPQLARLLWLEELLVGVPPSLLPRGVPAAWGLPGAFPRLKR